MSDTEAHNQPVHDWPPCPQLAIRFPSGAVSCHCGTHRLDQLRTPERDWLGRWR